MTQDLITLGITDANCTAIEGTLTTLDDKLGDTRLDLTLGIQRGNEGSQGQPGNNGSDGGQGPQGTQVPPFAQAVVDGVTTLDPGQQATVQTSFDGNNVHFTIGIPRGNDGRNGTNGSDGSQWPQGPLGEITQAQLNSAMSGISNKTNGVSTLGTAFADPDMEALRQKVNEMILNGRR